MKRVLMFLVYFSSLWGLEYKFNVIAEIPRSVPIDIQGFHLFIDDTDHNGLKELIFSTYYYYDVYRRPTPTWDIWEYSPKNKYELKYTGPTDTAEGGYPLTVGDIDKDGLSDMIVYYGWGHYEDSHFSRDSIGTVMFESSDSYSYPTGMV